MTLPVWWQVAKPHKDIIAGRLSEAIFAADLGNVFSGTAPPEYQDAVTFFEKTYVTKGLKDLLENVFSCLAGTGGDPVIQLQTPFGGGKTHALLALYHQLNIEMSWTNYQQFLSCQASRMQKWPFLLVRTRMR